jgi:flagella synthesis protein FlgN
MASVLNSLETVITAEQQQLSAGQINGSALQRVTEDKSSLLATLGYLDTLRQAEQTADRKHAVEVEMQWQTMQQLIQRLSNLNQHNGWLLESQREHTEQALAILKPHQAPEFYGADGQAKSAANYANKKIAY